MKRVGAIAVGLLLSLALAAGGMYGCSVHEWARQGQPQDETTHIFALMAYIGMAATVLTVIGLIFAVVRAVRGRRRVH
jgi:heme/copper-type cytochrome/quinol oxidase subunit 2